MTLVSKKRSQSASAISTKGLGSKMPILLTRMSASGTARVRVAAPSAVARSAAIPASVAPGTSCCNFATAAAVRPASRPLSVTAAPAAARPRAIAKPMPAVEPLTTADRPFRSIIMGSFPSGHPVAFPGQPTGAISSVPHQRANSRVSTWVTRCKLARSTHSSIPCKEPAFGP